MDILTATICAMMTVESHGDINAVGDGGKSIGCLQISQGVLDDVNTAYHTAYTMDDAKNWFAAMIICRKYLTHYCGVSASAEVYAKTWNGGPKGAERACTQPYWERVKSEIEKA